MAPVVINSVIQLPVHLVTLVLRKLRLVPTGSATHHTFPVAGLDEGRAHAVLYALRQAALDAQVELSSTSCCQSSLISSTFCCRCSCVLFELRRSKLQNCGWWLFNWHRSPQTGVIQRSRLLSKTTDDPASSDLGCYPAATLDDLPVQAPARLAYSRSQPRVLAEQTASWVTSQIYAFRPRPSVICSRCALYPRAQASAAHDIRNRQD